MSLARESAQADHPASPEPPLQTLEGTLERLTYQNPENGYTVARLQPKGKSYEVTAVGNLAGAAVGELLHLRGYWRNHAEYGRQFEVRPFACGCPPPSRASANTWAAGSSRASARSTPRASSTPLASAPSTSSRASPSACRTCRASAPAARALIRQCWAEQKQIKEIMIFLQGQGIGAGLAVRIYKHYGNDALRVVQHDPYRLAQDVHGIGFKTADKIARALGAPLDSPQRIQAGLRHVLSTLCDEGHCFATQAQLLPRAAELLEAPPAACREQLAALIRQQDLVAEEEAIYLPAFHQAEVSVARKLRLLQHSARDRLQAFKAIDWARAFAWLQERSALELVEPQMQAVRMALSEKVSILTGGPGTGKSTIIGSLIALLLGPSRAACSSPPPPAAPPSA
jgi:exodeoxyribonuclease V alpha subunit